MINNIIFSFDRPMQLSLLLESIKINADKSLNISVLYKYSNEEFNKGYEILKSRFPYVNWVEEIDFKKQTLELIQTDSEFTCFLVDDDIFFEPFNAEDIINALNENESIFCFSPRQGLNTKKCYTLKSDNIILPDKEDDKFIYWDWTKRYADAGYPLSLDGHIFRSKEIVKLIKKVSFSNPNTLEGGLQMFDNFPKEIMFAYKHSCLVNSPNNIVNTTYPNRQGEKHSLSTKELNDKFLNNEVIDYNAIDFLSVDGAHYELEFKFKKI